MNKGNGVKSETKQERCLWFDLAMVCLVRLSYCSNNSEPPRMMTMNAHCKSDN